jgi:2-octaprenylphenol hydroxylase
MAEFDIGIVGAGIAGGALACALQDSDYRIALVEASPLLLQVSSTGVGVDGFDSRVSAITPASQQFLTSLGAWDGILQHRVCPYQYMRVWDGEGTGVIDFSADEVQAERLGHIIENRVITSSLMSKVVESGRVTLFNPARVEDVLRRDCGSPSLVLEDGQQLDCELLVGADGALSKLRELAQFKTREWDYGHHALVCTVETQLSHESTAYQRFMKSGPLAFLPLADIDGHHYCSIVWSIESSEVDAIVALEDEEFLNRLQQSFEGRLGHLRACSRRVAFPLRQRHAIDYVQPGLALVGDAAHTIHPLAGQGINLGLQDVAVLAQELLQSTSSPGDLALLKRYQRQRKGDNLLMMAAMDGFKQLFGQGPLPLRVMRGIGMRLANRAGPVKQEIMRRAMGIR